MNIANPYHMELAVLGAVIVDPDVLKIPEVRALRPHHLRHLGGAWTVVRELDASGQQPSLTELAARVGTPGWPTNLSVEELINLEAYTLPPHELPGAVGIILNAYRREHANAAGAGLQRALQDGDTMAAITAAHATLTDLMAAAPRDSAASVADDLASALERITNPAAHRGVTTGLRSLDATLGGWQPGTLNIIAARPSMGKSALLGQLAQAAALGGASRPTRALLFTLEDGKVITRMRTLSRLSGVAISHDQPPSQIQAQKLSNAAARLEDLRDRWLLDEEGTLDGIVATCWRKHAEGKLGLVLIDQLSHVVADAPRGRADNRTQLYGYITKTLKRDVAQRLGVPVILASQLSREVTKRTEARPQLTDLRDSGELEQDADTVTFIHRPDYYDPTDNPGAAELIVAKNRNGATKTVTVNANLKFFKFWEDHA